ncbi:alpha/beta hydrolase [Pseudonocardia aurantiaca]|uniref:Alpha/beta fold hydrolase n=1 Tax=Pseudonocardia aurantiaca TaxID=75290 RepID=A0ABW4FQU5_9PSEU
MNASSTAAIERTVDAGGCRLRVVEQGAGPVVILCHGFPGLAHSWRNQLPVLASNGFRAIAPDMRGYGGSGRPSDPANYDRTSTVGDMVGLMDALHLDTAVFVGHDFGANLVWDLPQWAPERVRALIQLSVPREVLPPVVPSTACKQVAESHFFHMHYFQEPGVADEELAKDPVGFLAKVFWALGGGGDYLDVFRHPSEGNGYIDVLPDAPPLPWPWMSQADFDVYVETYARTGFTGGLNWYRAMDHVWHEKQSRPGMPITVPTVFVTGEKDPVLQIVGEDALAEMRASVPGLTGVHVIPGAGHFVQMEAADEVNRIMVEFLHGLD